MQHTVHMTFDAHGHPIPVSADGNHVEMKRRVENQDEIRWTSIHGTVEVEFQDGTPLAEGSKTGGERFQTIAGEPGNSFDYKCTITTPDGKKHGWGQGHSGGGGGVEVGGGRSQSQ